jgi:transcriptional regulator with XRE-family HTH domain
MPSSRALIHEVERLLDAIPLTQIEIANHLGVTQSQVSHYKYGRVKISPEHLEELRRLAKNAHRDGHVEKESDSDIQSASQSYGEWLAEQLDALSVTQARLAKEADVHTLTISNIVNEKTEPQIGSRNKIKQALDRLSRKERQPLVEPAPEHDPSEPIVGNLFTEEEIDQAPSDLGVYVIHDMRGWPTYVGKGNVRNELRYYFKQKWASTEPARKFSYALVRNDQDADRIETILIKFMADSLLVNQKKRVTVAERK